MQDSCSISLKVPGAPAGTAQQPVAFIVIENPLIHRVPLKLAPHGKRKISQNANMRRAHTRFDIHDGLLAALDAVFEILAMTGAAKHFYAATRDHVLLGLRLGVGVLAVAIGHREFALVT